MERLLERKQEAKIAHLLSMTDAREKALLGEVMEPAPLLMTAALPVEVALAQEVGPQEYALAMMPFLSIPHATRTVEILQRLQSLVVVAW